MLTLHITQINASASLQLCQGDKVKKKKKGDCSVHSEGHFVPRVVQTAGRSRPFTVLKHSYECFKQDKASYPPPQTRLRQFSTTYSMRQIQYDSLSVYTITGTGQRVRKDPFNFCCCCASCQEGLIMSPSRPCGQQDWDAGRQAHGAVNPNNGMPQIFFQLFTALTQFMWMTLVDQPVTVRAAPVRAEPSCRQNVWRRTWLHADIHTIAQSKLLVFPWDTWCMHSFENLKNISYQWPLSTSFKLSRLRKSVSCWRTRL